MTFLLINNTVLELFYVLSYNVLNINKAIFSSVKI